MKQPPLPEDEQTRLARLDALQVVYSPAEERFDRITTLARRIFDVPIALVSLVSKNCQWFKSAQGLPVSETPREISFCGHAILGNDTLVVPDALRNPDFADNPLVTDEPFIRFYAGHPLRYEGSNLGTLCIIDRVPRQLSLSELETLQSLAGWAENELKVSALSEAQTRLLEERDEARREALLDPLTKVWNRKGMDELLTCEISLAQRQRQHVCAMLLDVDHYKAVNDRYGHLAGDLALKEVARRIRSSVRPQDVIVRYGGDEFLVFASDCPEKNGKCLAERIRERVGAEPVTDGNEKFSLSLSIGVSSSLVTTDFDINRLIEAADTALYAAKAAGRNCFQYARA